MNDWRLVCMEKEHSLCYLLSDTHSSPPRQRNLRFMQNIEKRCSMTVLTDYIIIILMLSYSYQCDQLRMMTNFHRRHYFPSKLFFSVHRCHIILYFLNCYFPSSPFSFEDFRRVAKSYFLFKFKSRVINNILLCIFFNLFHNKPF